MAATNNAYLFVFVRRRSCRKTLILVQNMLEERQADVEMLQQQLDAANLNVSSEAAACAALQAQLEKMTSATDEREEDLYVAQERVKVLEEKMAKLQEELGQHETEQRSSKAATSFEDDDVSDSTELATRLAHSESMVAALRKELEGMYTCWHSAETGLC